MRSLLLAAAAFVFTSTPAFAGPSDGGDALAMLAQGKKKRTTKKRSRKRRRRRTPSKPVVDIMLEKGTIGLQVGFSGSYLECDCVGAPGDQDYDTIYNLAAGVVYDKAVNRFFSYRLGGRYHAKGAAFDVGGGRDYEVIFNTGEVQAAGLLRYTLNPFTTLYLQGGLFAAAILSADATLDGRKTNDLDDQFSFLDYGLSIGAGGFFALSRSRGLMASATLNYQHGFADIASEEQNLEEGDGLLTRAVVITGGIHF